MAIEDAAVLADVLRDATDIPAALRRYEAERKPRVMRMAAESAQTGDIYHLGGIKGAARNLALRVSGEKMFFERSDWIYRWAPEPPAGPTPTA